MIWLTNNPLQLLGCHQISCHFDKAAYDDAEFAQRGLVLPERLAGAVPKRKAEFLAGRYCVRLALKEMGEDAGHNIGVGEQRAPLWPNGLIGSITHSQGFASAAIARDDLLRGIGIDSEQLIGEKTAANVASHILVDSETYEANRALVDGPRQYLTLVFSAKESIFKCVYPQVKRYFDFRDAEIFLDPDNTGNFRFRLRKGLTKEFAEGYSGSGQYAIVDDFVHTAVVLR
ncbi:MAG: 4'-phosphopantetheinyl transferase superfamily protein [Cellvibrionaceae bacterium]